MVSSEDDAKLLLTKWISEASHVVALFAMQFPGHPGDIKPGLAWRISGHIASIDSAGTFALVPDGVEQFSPQDRDFLLVSIAACGFGYENFADSPLLPYIPKDWGSLLVVVFPNGSALVLFASE